MIKLSSDYDVHNWSLGGGTVGQVCFNVICSKRACHHRLPCSIFMVTSSMPIVLMLRTCWFS